MQIRLIAAGTRLPGWINEGYREYAGRFGAEIRLDLIEIPVTHRGKNADVARARAAEGERMLAAIGAQDDVVALEVEGRAYSTAELARWLAQRLQSGRDLSLLIGGPDGLAPECLAQGQQPLVAVAPDPAAWPGPGGGR